MRLERIRSRRLVVGRVLADDLVEGLLRVEHHRPELAAVGLDARRRRTAPGRPGARRCRARAARASRRAASPGRSSAPRPACRAPPSRRRSPPRSSSCRRRPSRRRRRSACPRAGRRPRPSGRHVLGERADLLDAELGARTGTAACSPAPRSSPPGGRAAGAGRAPGGSRSAPPGRRPASARAARPAATPIRCDLVLGEALRVEAVAEDPVDRRPRPRRRGRAPATRSR